MDLFVISGVTGMTGNELARMIISSGHRVIGFDNFFASSIDVIQDILHHPQFTFFEYDLNDADQMDSLKSEVSMAQSDCERTIYVNCAAVVHTEYFYKVDFTFETNVVSMQRFLDQAIDVHADIFINCSTSEVYSMESYRDGGVRESDFVSLATVEHSQRTSYATGKLLTEFITKDAVDKGLIKACSIRFANVYSKNERFAKHIIPHVIHSLSSVGAVTLLENSKRTYRTFLHNIDSCSAVLHLINHECALDGTVYNVGTDEEIHILDLVKLCAEEMGISNPPIYFEGSRASDPERRLLNTEKIRKKTGWAPRISLREGIRMCIEEIEK